VSVDEIRNARLHMVLIVDVDRARIQEIDPEDYVEMGRQWSYGAGEGLAAPRGKRIA